MTPSQQIQIRISETRQKLNAFAEKETITEAEQTEADALTKEYNGLEVQLRAALVGEGETRETTTTAPRELLKRAELRNYLHEAATGRPVQGAEAELRQEVFREKAADGLIPWEMLLPSALEARVDAATSAPSGLGRNEAEIIPRVFSQSSAEFLGVSMPAVARGERVYPVMTGGVSPENKSPGDEKDAEAATFSVLTLAPIRLTARYVFRAEDLARMSGLEDVLRADLRLALSDAMDAQVLNGNGTAPNVNGFLSEIAASGSAPSNVLTFSELLETHAASVDGLYANSLAVVRLLVGPATYRKAAGIFSSSGDVSGGAYLTAHSGGFRAGYHIPDPSNAVNLQSALTYALGGAGSAVAPVWEGLELIRDPFSRAASGEIGVTAIALWNFKVLREAPYKHVQFKTAS